jgi:hypothetical protein
VLAFFLMRTMHGVEPITALPLPCRASIAHVTEIGAGPSELSGDKKVDPVSVNRNFQT